ncbi:hypothetical protein CAPTEDRAFT_195132 [Capitella teleta]|uniref:Uncharacterized protein n=1 Tax=Capitella teleta TaxID=283909 RepID=R7VJZ2_CAPTE|nr:hypothetical protein CAPTEDRAFT_195132 [Capitella teleta]|eukprot:ELU16901.1 hypothetical protein CAPTEDRAFT_195132 [Capitella teleta]
MMPDSKGRETKPGMQSFKYGTNGRQWNQDTLQLLGGTTKDDASSLQSGDGSNTDSGRGLSEAELESNKMHAHLSEGSVDTPATSGALHTVQASPHYQPPRSAPHCTTFSSFRGEESPLGKSTMTSPSTPNNNYKNGVIPTKQIDKRSHPYYKHDYNPKSLPKIPEKSPNSSSSESQRNNKSRGVNKRSTGCHGDRSPTNSDVSTLNRHNLTDDDAATTTSGSYVMDPQDLADDLEQQAFCQGVVV